MRTLLNFVGACFTAVAAWLIYSGFQVQIIVPDQAMKSAGLLPAGSEGVVNLGLMHTQAMLFHLGIGAAIVAAVTTSAAALITVLESRPFVPPPEGVE